MVYSFVKNKRTINLNKSMNQTNKQNKMLYKYFNKKEEEKEEEEKEEEIKKVKQAKLIIERRIDNNKKTERKRRVRKREVLDLDQFNECGVECLQRNIVRSDDEIKMRDEVSVRCRGLTLHAEDTVPYGGIDRDWTRRCVCAVAIDGFGGVGL